MNEHVTAVVAELEGRADALKAMANELRREFGMDKGPAWSSEPVRNGAQPVSVKKKITRTAKAPGGVFARNQRNLELVGKLAEPFTIAQVEKEIGVGFSSTALNWQERGWLKKVAYGQYQRGPKFPLVPEDKTLPMIRTGTSGEDLGQKIRGACAARDAANAKGLTKIAAVHQAEIDRLEKARAMVE